MLNDNKIGDAGLTALAKAVENGALAQLDWLQLSNNEIGDSGVKALADAVSSGALDNLTVRWCPTALSPCPWNLACALF